MYQLKPKLLIEMDDSLTIQLINPIVSRHERVNSLHCTLFSTINCICKGCIGILTLRTKALRVHNEMNGFVLQGLASSRTCTSLQFLSS